MRSVTTLLYQIVSNIVPEHTPTEGPHGEPADPGVRVRRGLNRADYRGTTINEILDAGHVAHVGTVRDGAPVVIPMFYVRNGDTLLIHGAPASGVIRRGDVERNGGVDVCMTVTLVDGLVLARSAFHHSMNYRSVVIIGRAEPVEDPDEKAAALHHFIEALVPGRQADLRPNTKKEIDGTTVLRLSLEHASAKVRAGEPVDDDEDYELSIWAGVVPMRTVFDAPIGDGRVLEGVSVPANVTALQS